MKTSQGLWMPYSSVTPLLYAQTCLGWGFWDACKIPRDKSPFKAGACQFLVVFYLLYYSSAAYREMSWAANIAKPLLVFPKTLFLVCCFRKLKKVYWRKRRYMLQSILLSCYPFHILLLPSIVANHGWTLHQGSIAVATTTKKEKGKNIFWGNFLFFFAFIACTGLIWDECFNCQRKSHPS